MGNFEYQLAKGEDGKEVEISPDSIVEKRGHVIRFSLREILVNHAQLEKVDGEMKGQMELQLAKMKNIEQHHGFVISLTPEELFTVHMYAEAKSIYTQCLNKRKEIEDTIKSDKEEIAEIKKQIPELDLPDPIAIPQHPGGLMDALNEAEARAQGQGGEENANG